ncbi:MAG: flavodoxin family protein [Clostridia bacterium]|nr:flavodoxin family protein [Clostridia bacterium]
MDKKTSVLILYHSGAGSTRMVAEIYHEQLHSCYHTDLSSVSMDYDYERFLEYDYFILAFPTYHCDPSTSMMEFIKNIAASDKPKRAFAFTTCGLFSGNTLRIFIKECLNKNIIVEGSSVYKAPATDGTLLLPSINFIYKFEKDIADRIRKDIGRIRGLIETETSRIDWPRFKLYSILNYPNKVLGKACKHRIRLIKELCSNCNQCVRQCIRNCWMSGKDYPQYEITHCEYCFRCIHQCPKEAIVLSSNTVKKRKLNKEFYEHYKKEVLKQLQK